MNKLVRNLRNGELGGCNLKNYSLEIECMREEGDGAITEMFSKGHHEESEFKKMCKEVYADECGESSKSELNDYSFIEDAKMYYKWGKVVGCFENGVRKGWSLSESKEHKKGYFPITKINI